ncbi:fatty acid synthase alpha subunit Lsd1 [Blastocladiella emersonii ATCC 22665]|nr:fatty acid synthase alpha subunit Lsd1 [Blastocladiella emersonii ATCC 22665]
MEFSLIEHWLWLGKLADGSVFEDLADMTFAEVVNRILKTTSLPELARWIPETAKFFFSTPGPTRVCELSPNATKFPATSTWLAELVTGTSDPDWLRALALSRHFVQGKMLDGNCVPRLLAPRAGMPVTITLTELALTLYDAHTPGAHHPP